MTKKTYVTGTDFYREKGLVKSVLLHLSEKTYEGLRLLAYKKKDSVQGTLRAILEEKLSKG